MKLSSSISSSDNVDAQELEKFNSLASRWWDKNSEFKPLHDMNPIRVNYIDQRSPLAGKRVLDIGCGGGILCEALAQRGADVTGIDMADNSLKVAKLHSLDSGLSINYQLTTAEEFASNTAIEPFDMITCLEMLEHVPDPSSIINACQTLLKPEGDLFLSTINRNPKSYMLAILGAEYVLNLLPRGTHQYEKFIKPSELGKCLRANRFSIQNLSGLLYNPMTKNFKLSETDTDVNYLVHAKVI